MILELTETHIGVSCYGGNNGLANLAANGGTSPYSYRWNDGDVSINRINLSAGNYSVTVTDNNSCEANKNIIITEPSEINISEDVTDPTCIENGNDGSIILNISGATTPYQYVWSDGSTLDNVTNLGAGVFDVTITDDNGCPFVRTFSLAYQFDFSVKAVPSITILKGESATLGYIITGNAGNFTTEWTPSEFLSCDNCSEPKASPEVTTLYEVIINNDANCSDSDTVRVKVVEENTIYTPNIFTPNGDGNNDEFQVFIPFGNPDFFLIQVFNRWGEKVFESNDASFKWDGTYRDKALAPDVYVYHIRSASLASKERVQKGSVTIMR